LLTKGRTTGKSHVISPDFSIKSILVESGYHSTTHTLV
jgi:hypothetical protein